MASPGPYALLRAARLPLLAVATLLVVALAPLLAETLPVVRANPFQDIPAGDPVYAIIDELVHAGIMEGYPDGTFKGDKVITRYDLALAVARAMARLEELKAQGRPASPEEEKLIRRLGQEVGVELGLMGVRLDSLERRTLRSEERAEKIDLAKSNVHMSGFYRLENSFVYHPVDYSDFPFVPQVDPFFQMRDRGLLPLKQEAFLRFAGRPVLEGAPVKNLDAFAELRARVVGNAGIFPVFSFSPDPTRAPTMPGDVLDDFATQVNDESRVFFNRAHFAMRTKNLNFRAFANESATDLTDPNVLFTVDTLAPYSGVEGNGSVKKVSYTASALKDIQLRQPSGVDARDITLFDQELKRTSDIYTMRLQYEPYKDGKDHRGKSLVFGGTFVEHAFSYSIPNDFFRTIAWDIQYSHHRTSRIDMVLTFLHSQGRATLQSPYADFGVAALQPDLLDTAIKFDSAYAKKGFLANLKLYTFGSDFRTDVAQNQFVDTDVAFNYNRAVTVGLPDKIAGLADPSTRGEQLLRLQLKNDWLGQGLRGIKNLVLSSLWELKSWNRDPRNPLFNDDENASRFYIQSLADVTRNWHVELFSEVIKRLRIDRRTPGVKDPVEKGVLTNTFRSDWRLRNNLSFITEFQLKDDLDSLDSDGRHFKMIRQKYEFPWQAHRRFFLKPTFEMLRNSDLQLYSLPITPINERNLSRQVYEANWIIFPKWSFKLLWVTQLTQNARLLAPSGGRNIRVEDNNTNIVIGENVFNFNAALKFRYIWANQNTHLFNTGVDPLFLSDINITNRFAELIYTPTSGTELRLSYGSEFENPNDPFDNGPAKFWRTEPILQFKAQTDF